MPFGSFIQFSLGVKWKAGLYLSVFISFELVELSLELHPKINTSDAVKNDLEIIFIANNPFQIIRMLLKFVLMVQYVRDFVPKTFLFY